MNLHHQRYASPLKIAATVVQDRMKWLAGDARIMPDLYLHVVDYSSWCVVCMKIEWWYHRLFVQRGPSLYRMRLGQAIRESYYGELDHMYPEYDSFEYVYFWMREQEDPVWEQEER